MSQHCNATRIFTRWGSLSAHHRPTAPGTATLAQVRHHQESTERQYALRQRAAELGRSESSIRILDRDLGISGAHTTGRSDFKTLVADVSMGQVARCLPWKLPDWPARMPIGADSWSYVR
jgi:hypothetical protein